MDLEFLKRKLKSYPHFDAPIRFIKVKALLRDPDRVAKNKFYPFLLYDDEHQPFRAALGGKPDKKVRPIRYASRRDAYIFTYYRRILSEKYEQRLTDLGISECPIAYRKISKDGQGGKCNIDFAKDAFDEIIKIGDCVAIALDIKGYFENLDHQKIKLGWCDLLGVERLPPDHFTVFKNITKYHFVRQEDVYRRLGFLEESTVDGQSRLGPTKSYNEIPIQLCTPAEFREKICGGNPELESLIKGNKLPYGIPQGAPISDLIANFYLIDFDCLLNAYAKKRGGRYMRYSDDILLIIPGGEEAAENAAAFAKKEIRKQGDNLEIKDKKTCVVKFFYTNSKLSYKHISGNQGKNGFEYLGFRFNGQYVYVRDSTMSRFYRKASRLAKATSYKFVFKNVDKNEGELINSFDYLNFRQKFNQVRRVLISDSDKKTWTFYSYIKRAIETFGKSGEQIVYQTRNFDKIIKNRVKKYLIKAIHNKKTEEHPY